MNKELKFPMLKDIEFNIPAYLDKGIEALLNEWKEIKARLEALYHNRDQQNTKVEMEKGLSLFIQFLFWSNEKSVIESEPIPFNILEIKPVNVEERLSFILARPNLYHSYRQLSELMVEQEKLYAKRRIVKKASRPKG